MGRKIKGKFTKGISAQDFVDFETSDIKELGEEQKKRMREMQMQRLKKQSKVVLGRKRIPTKGKRPKVNVRGGIKGLWDII